MTNLRILIVAGVVLTAGVARAAPRVQAASPTLENRAQLIAARMSRTAEPYDRATSAIQSVVDERTRAILLEMREGVTYRQARLAVPEDAARVNGRWTRHLVAMVQGGAHEAGWAASANQ